MSDSFYTPERIADILRTARNAVTAHQAGKTTTVLGSGASAQEFDLAAGGMCNRFVRQCFEVGLHIPPFTWRYRGPFASTTLRKLTKGGRRIAGKCPDPAILRPGDIVGHRRWVVGHIAIYVGEIDGVPMVAENTISARRGDPRGKGTKLTPYAAIRKSITEAHRLLATPPATVPLKIIDHETGEVIKQYDMVRGGDHIADQGKVYVRR